MQIENLISLNFKSEKLTKLVRLRLLKKLHHRERYFILVGIPFETNAGKKLVFETGIIDIKIEKN